jgi:hypothetical protein
VLYVHYYLHAMCTSASASILYVEYVCAVGDTYHISFTVHFVSFNNAIYYCKLLLFYAGRCNLCTEELSCASVGSNIASLSVAPGLWRANLDTLSTLECYNTDACKGGVATDSTAEYCSKGYTGPCKCVASLICFFVYTQAHVLNAIAYILTAIIIIQHALLSLQRVDADHSNHVVTTN